MVVTDWGDANSIFLGLVTVGAAQSLDQMPLRPSVIKRITSYDVKHITHMQNVLAEIMENVHRKKGEKKETL